MWLVINWKKNTLLINRKHFFHYLKNNNHYQCWKYSTGNHTWAKTEYTQFHCIILCPSYEALSAQKYVHGLVIFGTSMTLGTFFFFFLVFVSHNIIELYLFMLVAIAHFLSTAATTRCPNASQNSRFVKFAFYYFLKTRHSQSRDVYLSIIPTSGPVHPEEEVEEIEGDHYRFINRHRLAV